MSAPASAYSSRAPSPVPEGLPFDLERIYTNLADGDRLLLQFATEAAALATATRVDAAVQGAFLGFKREVNPGVLAKAGIPVGRGLVLLRSKTGDLGSLADLLQRAAPSLFEGKRETFERVFAVPIKAINVLW